MFSDSHIHTCFILVLCPSGILHPYSLHFSRHHLLVQIRDRLAAFVPFISVFESSGFFNWVLASSVFQFQWGLLANLYVYFRLISGSFQLDFRQFSFDLFPFYLQLGLVVNFRFINNCICLLSISGSFVLFPPYIIGVTATGTATSKKAFCSLGVA
jgi:hypothetical protein